MIRAIREKQSAALARPSLFDLALAARPAALLANTF